MEPRLAWALFARAVAACLLISLASLLPQLPGLVGPAGPQPAHQALAAIDAAAAAAGMPVWAKLLRFPTGFWLLPDCTARQLQAVCGVGLAASATALLGVGLRLPLVVAIGCWISLLHVSGEFLCYPWDWLLVEAAALATLLPQPAPGELRLRRLPETLVEHAIRFLGFRLMLGMGLKKFYDLRDCPEGSSCWTDEGYLKAFYIWQPMGTPAAWLAHHGGDAFHRAGTLAVKITQLVIPLGIIGPFWLRALVVVPMLAEQCWIQLIGNFGIFNFVSAALLSFPLLARRERGRPRRPSRGGGAGDGGGEGEEFACSSWQGQLVAGLALANMIGGAFYLIRPLIIGDPSFTWLSSPFWLFDTSALDDFRNPLGAAFPLLSPALRSVLAMLRVAAPFRVCNPYGIFRTGLDLRSAKTAFVYEYKGGRRPVQWHPFVWQTSHYQATGGVSELRGLPAWFAPHQPRLDHSVFYQGFAGGIGQASFDNEYTVALSDCEASTILVGRALLQESGETRALLAHAPAFGQEEPLVRLRGYMATCSVKPLNASSEEGALAQLRRAAVGGGGERLWRRCRRVKGGFDFKGTLPQLQQRERQLRKKAQRLFKMALKRQWAEARPEWRAGAVPAVALAATLGSWAAQKPIRKLLQGRLPHCQGGPVGRDWPRGEPGTPPLRYAAASAGLG